MRHVLGHRKGREIFVIRDDFCAAFVKPFQSAPASGAKLSLDLVARVVRDFSENFRHAFEGGSTQEKKEIIRRVVGKVVVDGQSRRVRVLVRRSRREETPPTVLLRSWKKQERHLEARCRFATSLCPEQDLNLHDLTATSS